jgi:hypothetical protein
MMDKAYTFSDIAKEFNFDSESLRKLFTTNNVPPAKTLRVGKRVIELYGDNAYALAKAERERRDATRAAKGAASPAGRFKPKSTVSADQIEDLKLWIEAKFSVLAGDMQVLLAGMEARLTEDRPRPGSAHHDMVAANRYPPFEGMPAASVLADLSATTDD